MNRDTRIVAGFVAVIPLAILSSAIAATFASPMWRLPFRLVCHGIVRRCLLLAGHPMPICARCAGIYAGFLIGLAVFPLFRRTSEKLLRIALGVVAVPMLIDGLTQAARLRESTNSLRLATGLTLGAAFGLWVVVAVETRARERFARS